MIQLGDLPGGLQPCKGTTLLFNTIQVETLVTWTHCCYTSVYTTSQQRIFPQTSTDEVCSAQNLNDMFQLVIQYLKDGTLPKDALRAEEGLKQEGQYFLSDDNILYRQLNAGKGTVIQLVVPAALQTELFEGCYDHFASGHFGLNEMYECLRSTYFWNNMFAHLQHWVKSFVFCAQMKRDVDHSKPPLLPIAISGPWEDAVADCMGLLPVTNLGSCYILIEGDLFT